MTERVFRQRLILIGAPILAVVAAWWIAPRALSPLAKARLETQGARVLGADLKIEKFEIVSLWPLQFVAKNIEMSWPERKAAVRIGGLVGYTALDYSRFSVFRPRFRTKLNVIMPRFDFALAPSGTKAQIAESLSQPLRDLGSSFSSIDSSLDLVMDSARVGFDMSGSGLPVRQLELSRFNIKLSRPSLRDHSQPMVFSTSGEAKVESSFYAPTVAFNVNVDQLILSPDEIRVRSVAGDLGGLEFTGKGRSDFRADTQDWEWDYKISEMSSLPISPAILPGKNWQGSISGRVLYRQNKGDLPYLASNFDLKKISGELDLNHENRVRLRGPFRLDARGRVVRYKIVSAPQMSIDGDFTDLDITIDDLFQKPTGRAFKVEGEGSLRDDYLICSKCALVLDRFQARGLGHLNLASGGRSDFRLEIPRVAVDGMEKLVPRWAAYPVLGELELNATVRGDVRAPERLEMRLKPFALRNFSASLDYVDTGSGRMMKGPLRADIRGELTTVGPDVRAAQLLATVDASQMEAQAGSLWRKPAGQTASLVISAQKVGDDIVLGKTSADLGSGPVAVKGRFKNPGKPEVNLVLEASALQLARVRETWPSMAWLPEQGRFTGSAQLRGVYDFALGWTQSPIAASVTSDIEFLRLNIEPAALKAPEWALPTWPLVRDSSWSTRLKVGEALLPGFSVMGLSGKARYERGQLSLEGAVERLWGGSANIRSFALDMRQSPAGLNADMVLRRFQISDALRLFSPDVAAAVVGRADFDFKASLPLVFSPLALEQAKLAGRLRSDGLKLPPAEAIQAVQVRLGQSSDVGQPGGAPSAIDKARVDADLKLEAGRWDAGRFVLRFPDLDSIEGRGSIGLDRMMELQARVALARPQVRPQVFLANKDRSGRLVLPIKMKGDFLLPDVHFAEDAVSRMMANVLVYETHNEAQKAKARESRPPSSPGR